jgi:hypothetical protein
MLAASKGHLAVVHALLVHIGVEVDAADFDGYEGV